MGSADLGKMKKKNNDVDEEILSDASDVEGRPDAGYESEKDQEDQDQRETPEEKRLRMAKEYLKEVEKEGKETGENERNAANPVKKEFRDDAVSRVSSFLPICVKFPIFSRKCENLQFRAGAVSRVSERTKKRR